MKIPTMYLFTTRRAVNYTLVFTAKTYLYNPVYAAKVIKETTNRYIYRQTSNSTREERIVVVPNPTTSDADDDFVFTTTITNFADRKHITRLLIVMNNYDIDEKINEVPLISLTTNL